MTDSRLRLARNLSWVLLAPALALLAGILFLPLILSFWRSISLPELGIGNYVELFTDGVTMTVIGRTVITAAIVMLVSMVLGYPYAYLMTRIGPRTRAVLLSVVLIPFWTSMMARNFAWLVLLQRDGLVETMFNFFGVEEIVLFGTTAGVVVSMSQVMLPFMVLPLFSSMSSIDRRLLVAARGLGSTPFAAFWKVYWPLSRNGVVAGGILVFSLSLGFYVTPAIIGSPQQSLIAQLLGQRTTQLLDFAAVGALGTFVLVVTLILVSWANRLTKDASALSALPIVKEEA